MTVNNYTSNSYQYHTAAVTNYTQKAIELGKPENRPSQISQGYVDGMRSFDVYDSKMSEDKIAMRKQTHQALLNSALLTKAAIIRSSQEVKGERVESAK